MNRQFCTKLAEEIDDLYFASKFKLAKILIASDSDNELLKGVCIENTRAGISVVTWFCPIVHFFYKTNPLMFMTFDGWQLGGRDSGLVSKKVSKEFLSPTKDESALLKEVANYIAHRMTTLKDIKSLTDFIGLSKLYPSAFSGVHGQLQLGLWHYSIGEKVIGESLLKKGRMCRGDYPLIDNDVEEFFSHLEKGSDIVDMHIIKMKERNKQYLEDYGFFNYINK